MYGISARPAAIRKIAVAAMLILVALQLMSGCAITSTAGRSDAACAVAVVVSAFAGLKQHTTLPAKLSAKRQAERMCACMFWS